MSVFRSAPDPSLGQSNFSPYIIGRVNYIVMGPYKIENGKKIQDPEYMGPADIGKIRFELMYSSITGITATTAQEPAYPMFNFVKQLPVLGEIVMVFPGPTEELNDKVTRQQFFYLPPFNVWSHVQHGVFPNMGQYSDFDNEEASQPKYQGSAVSASNYPMGETFKENSNIRNLRPFEGDTILQSRFGQSIRFGSTVVRNNQNIANPNLSAFQPSVPSQIDGKPKPVNNWSNLGKNGDPITIIVNSQGNRPEPKYVDLVEDINEDGSAIYMTSTQQIFLKDLSDDIFPLKSFGITSIGSISDSIRPPIEISYFPLTNENISATEQDERAAAASDNSENA